jgi:nucleoside-diphosphate-sugar epimerase
MPGSSRQPLPPSDLDHVLEHTRELWDELRGGRLLVTGGTGFFGGWILESFLHATDRLELGASAVVLTRDSGRLRDRAPHIALHPAASLHEGDVRTFAFPDGAFTHVLHLATEAGPSLSPASSFDTAVHGTERVLEFSVERGVESFLLASSGAVYGSQPRDRERLDEEFAGAPRPEDASAGYGHGKRAAEYLCAVSAAESRVPAKIARCFAFVGPLLPLDANFAIGNFIRDALSGQQITVNGDGTARRSYLYAADLAIWLWTILVRGQAGRPYNVGSEEDLSIADLATRVADVLRPGIQVTIAEAPNLDDRPARYVPSTARAQQELGLRQHVGLDGAVRRTAEWYSGGQMPHGDG